MAIRPSVPEIITVNSEALQTQIRDLLPSQNGFGSELQASNVITPIIDLTAAAEGTGLRSDLQSALSFGSMTAFTCTNQTTVIANTPGFYRIYAAASVRGRTGSTLQSAQLSMSDSLSTKVIWSLDNTSVNTQAFGCLNVDIVVFLTTGDSISAICTQDGNLDGSVRQIANAQGELVNPSGYPV